MLRFDPFRELAWRTLPAATQVPFDAERSEDQLVLRFDLPGFAAEDIDVTVDRGVLRLTAERSLDRHDDGVTVLRRERIDGKVSRRLALGDRYDTARVEASFDNGVLTVTLPVAETARPRRVEITSTHAIEAGEPAEDGAAQAA